MYLPYEFLIIGAAITLGKKTVTNKVVSKYYSRCKYPIEYDSEDKLYYCSFEKDKYTISDNIQVPPYILQILTSI